MHEQEENALEAGAVPSAVQAYDFNFFKPSSEYAKANTRLIGIVVLIWAIAVFGFQFLLKSIEKPVPEAQLATFEQVWPDAVRKTATQKQLRDLSEIYLNLIGRHISLRSNDDFKLAFTSTVYDLIPESERLSFVALTQKDLSERKALLDDTEAKIGLEKDGILAQVLPYALVPYKGQKVDASTLEAIPGIMQKYLVHNRSVLTDSKILGFPFHYFYTAVFLLTLFVVLCLVYCRLIDNIVVKYGMEDDEA